MVKYVDRKDLRDISVGVSHVIVISKIIIKITFVTKESVEYSHTYIQRNIIFISTLAFWTMYCVQVCHTAPTKVKSSFHAHVHLALHTLFPSYSICVQKAKSKQGKWAEQNDANKVDKVLKKKISI